MGASESTGRGEKEEETNTSARGPNLGAAAVAIGSVAVAAWGISRMLSDNRLEPPHSFPNSGGTTSSPAPRRRFKLNTDGACHPKYEGVGGVLRGPSGYAGILEDASGNWAEEAQQLRRLQKRKKAETLRLLDMERRQKQRVEEIRESQKKDEENMNLKEVYRTEVRHELNKLEKTCLDMASLLRGLGIQVGDSPCASSHEVRAAYKRALLSFHPDRAAGSDMRQQVEAEEKFKLISRMKEKLSL